MCERVTVAWGEEAPIADNDGEYYVKMYSNNLEEHFVLETSGDIVFKSGVRYTRDEWLAIGREGLSVEEWKRKYKNSEWIIDSKKVKRKKEELKAIHEVKKMFDGSKVLGILKREENNGN